MLTSLRTLYKIGPGPSSSHTMGPAAAAAAFKAELPEDFSGMIDVTLFGSLALTGHGHMTDRIILKVLSGFKALVSFDIKTPVDHPNTMVFAAYDSSGREVIRRTYISVGGGSVILACNEPAVEEGVYDVSCFDELRRVLEHRTLADYVIAREKPEIVDYLRLVLRQMFATVKNGLNAEGYVAGELRVKRVARDIAALASSAVGSDAVLLELCSYAYAVAEENAAGGTVVTAPTCGSAGILPALLYYLSVKEGYGEESLIEGLMMAGLVGLTVKHNATISGAVGGCQAEIGTASAMGAAALTYLKSGADIGAVEYAAELAMEHSLGLPCDPVRGYVAIPCIERNAVGALKSYESSVMARFIGRTRRNSVSFDEVVAAMAETGRSLPSELRETALGGLAKTHKC